MTPHEIHLDTIKNLTEARGHLSRACRNLDIAITFLWITVAIKAFTLAMMLYGWYRYGWDFVVRK